MPQTQSGLQASLLSCQHPCSSHPLPCHHCLRREAGTFPHPHQLPPSIPTTQPHQVCRRSAAACLQSRLNSTQLTHCQLVHSLQTTSLQHLSGSVPVHLQRHLPCYQYSQQLVHRLSGRVPSLVLQQLHCHQASLQTIFLQTLSGTFPKPPPQRQQLLRHQDSLQLSWTPCSRNPRGDLPAQLLQCQHLQCLSGSLQSVVHQQCALEQRKPLLQQKQQLQVPVGPLGSTPLPHCCTPASAATAPGRHRLHCWIPSQTFGRISL